MRVTVIGGTGRIGKRVVARLVDGAHEVRSVNRRQDRAEVLLGALPVERIAANAGDLVAMDAAFDDADAVLVTIAPTREHPADFLAQHAAVLKAAGNCAVPRLVAVTNHMALLAPDGRSMLEAQPSNPYFRELESVFVEQVALYRATIGVDWLLVSPPAELFPYGETTGHYRTGVDTLVVTDTSNPDFKEVSALSMEDFADLLVTELVEPAHSHMLLTAAY
jgi:putative NADH-flavin reductase